MAGYRASQSGDRAKALTGVVAVHLALGAAILTGLNVDSVSRAVESLKTFDVPRPLSPPPPEPEQLPDESSAPRDEASPANIRSRPTPVVAPPPRIPPPIPLPMTVSEMAGPEGTDRTAGASDRPGAGTGAGGEGSGFGGGGSGGSGTGSGGGGQSPAVLTRNIARSDYRRIGGDLMRSGSAGLALEIDSRGRVSGCRVERSSGNPAVDSRLCALAQQRLRFRPARDSAGRPVPYFVNYLARWSPR